MKRALFLATVLGLAVQASASSASDSDFAVLSMRAGVYTLTSNDPNNPCYFAGGDLAIGTEALVTVLKAPDVSEYYLAGDVILKLERYFPQQRPITLFDRGDFGAVNRGASHSRVDHTMTVTRETTYDHKTTTLKHTVVLADFRSSEESVQEIVFNDAENKFVYSHEIHERNFFGITTSSLEAGRCEFSLKPTPQ